ncbi:MAG: hypothetical protein CMD18_05425 [Flavobacteriales bacterium]|nr:hypothetical protein [Flavobacteriales bacterium]|tara:strand:- start:339 stop:971 length:633 start_codon:yes stop_codon:yes gene_type:complete
MRRILFYCLSIQLLAFYSCKKENEDTTAVQVNTPSPFQESLDDGETPLEIYQSGVSVDSLYGKTYQGGLITYLDTINGNGIIATPFDESEGLEWGYRDTLIDGADGTSIGTGKQNTVDILKAFTDTNSAAYFCDTLTLGGYSDWFLPSKNELNLLRKNLYNNGFGNFENNGYWSSTDVDLENAQGQGFVNGNFFSTAKNAVFFVRAIREF